MQCKRNLGKLLFCSAVMGIMFAVLLLATLKIKQLVIVIGYSNKNISTTISGSCHCTSKTTGTMINMCYQTVLNNTEVKGKAFSCQYLPYLEDLQLTEPYTNIKFPDFDGSNLSSHPPLVASASSNHFHELLAYIEIVQNVFRAFKMYVFDLGLTNNEKSQLNRICGVNVRHFNFSKYPNHVRKLFQFHWKPLVLAEMLKEVSVFWYTDPSVVWKRSDFYKEAYGGIRCHGNGNCEGNVSPLRQQNLTITNIYMVTQKDMYSYFPNSKEYTVKSNMYCGGVLFVVKSIETLDSLKWWVLCALQSDCMAPSGSQLNCGNRLTNKNAWSNCHRFDQSAISLILNGHYGHDERRYTQQFRDQSYLTTAGWKRVRKAVKMCPEKVVCKDYCALQV